MRIARGACLSVQRGHDGERCKIQLVKEEDVGGLNLDVIRREHVRRIVLHVAGDDKIGATYNGSCHDMAVIGIGEADDMFQRLPAGH